MAQSGLSKRLEELEEFVDGNGTRGAKTRLYLLEAHLDKTVTPALDELEKWRETTEKFIGSAQFSIKVMTWVFATFGLSVIAFIWSLITHAVEIVH